MGSRCLLQVPPPPAQLNAPPQMPCRLHEVVQSSLPSCSFATRLLLNVSDTLPRVGGSKAFFQWFLGGMPPPPPRVGGSGLDFLGCCVCEPWDSKALNNLT